MPIVSVVIVCMDRMDNLYPCLTTLKEHTSIDFETLVVAYMFSQEHLKQAEKDFPWVRFIVSNELRGFSENNNLALAQAQGEYCFILNDDTEMHEDVIGRLLDDFRKLPENCAIVSPKLLNRDGSLQLCGRPPFPAYKYVLQQFHLYKEAIDNVSGKTPEFDSVFRSWNITGAAFLIRTEIFRELGWFDEKYFFTPEDIALSTLAVERGYSLYVDAGTSIIHKWRTTASRIFPATRPAAVRGSLIFWSRGSSLEYVLLAVPVWCAEFSKRCKAAIRQAIHPGEENRLALRTFRNISRSIFTHRSTRDIFIKYYTELKNE